MSADRAYELIREQLFSLELDPGMSVSQIALVRQVGMSPDAVSAAVERLIQEGWLERVDRNIRVTEESLTNIFQQLFEVRSVLEALCARMATVHATQEQLDYLQSLMPEFEDAARRADSQFWIQLDQRFHEAIYEASGNLFLRNTLKQIYALDLRIWYLVLNRMTDLPRIVESHRAIVTALQERDARTAERALTKHIRDSQIVVMPEMQVEP
jgi:DNA-binding GntR family transcriptional regulator